ncbi:MAG: hypothetical protein ACFFDI_24315 [Promethearchaeota archaeon]
MSEEDIFLNTFNKMIELLEKFAATVDSIKQSVEVILSSIDGLGAGITNINSQLVDLSTKFEKTLGKPVESNSDIIHNDLVKIQSSLDSLSKTLVELSLSTPSSTTDVARSTVAVPEKKEQPTPSKAASEVTPSTPAVHPQWGPSGPQHPIFIDLYNRINSCSKYKEAGEILIASLDQIESTFSFSRVFYEIRREGNDLIRKGDAEIPPNEKIDLTEKILDWEKRLVEGATK